MKRLLLSLILVSGSVFALTPAEQQEVDFIAAITSGNIPAIRAQLDKGKSANHQFALMGYRGYTPLSIALMEKVPVYEYRKDTIQMKGQKPNAANQFQVIELLVSRGANKDELNILAKDAIAKGDTTKALNLVNAGASDKKLLEAVNAQDAKETSEAKKIVWQAIKKKLGAPVVVREPVPTRAVSAEKKERDLYDALAKSDLAGVKAAIAAGASAKEFSHLPEFKNVPFADRQPIVWVRSNPSRWAIIDYLLSAGVNRTALNGMLIAEANEGDIDALKDLISRGAQDIDGKALAKAQEKEKEFSSDPQQLEKFTAIRNVLENMK